MNIFQKIKEFINKVFNKNTKPIQAEEPIIETPVIVKEKQDTVKTEKPLIKQDTITTQEPLIIEEKQDTTKTEEKKDTVKVKKKPVETKLSSKNPKYDKIVIFLTPGHTKYTPGKHSPDKKLYEWEYNRIILKMIEQELDKLGIQHWNSHPEDGWVDNTHQNDSKDLILRVQRINSKYTSVKKEGKTAIMLSIHVNAAGNGITWKNATGWSAWTTKGQNNSDKLADCLYDAAEKILKPLKKKIREDKSDGDRDYESNFYVIKNSNCIGVLTENFFMDSKQDCEWLLSDEGKKAITDIHIEGIKKYIEKYIK